MGPPKELIEEGNAALRCGDTAIARTAFLAASTSPMTGVVLEGLARAAYLDHDYRHGIELWSSAYEAYRREGDGVGAIRTARTLAYMNGTILGDGAVMSGWLARAVSLLEGEEPSAERGWVELNRGMFEADRRVKEARFREALTVARSFGDASLEFATLAYLGASLVAEARTGEGMRLLDEALAAVAGRDVDDVTVVEEIFCQLFEACERAHDIDRADQWIRVGEDVAARRNLPTVAAFCRTHYGGLLTAAGRWAEADTALSDAVRLWSQGHSSLRPGALVRLAELRIRQGRIEEAEQLLVGFDDVIDAARPLAAVRLIRGQVELAIDVLDRALDELDPEGVEAAPLWGLLVEAHLTGGRPDLAAAAADRLEACAAVAWSSDYVRAVAALAQGRTAAAVSADQACARLRDARAGFAKARTPWELARARLELAAALAVEHPELALNEARVVLEEFDRLPARRDADAAAALLRALGGRDRPGRQEGGVLTKRESEVLDLVGHGLSNPEIADRLFISRKTVEHHVSNILSKLHLRSRAEAAAYAARTKPADPQGISPMCPSLRGAHGEATASRNLGRFDHDRHL